MKAIKTVMKKGQVGPAIELGSTVRLSWNFMQSQQTNILESNSADQLVIENDDSVWQYYVLGERKGTQMIVTVDKDKKPMVRGQYAIIIMILDVKEPLTQAQKHTKLADAIFKDNQAQPIENDFQIHHVKPAN